MLDIQIDPLGGMAGDMFVAALLDLRPDLGEGLKKALSLCPLLDRVTCEISSHNDGVIAGMQFLVRRDGKTDDAGFHGHWHSEPYGQVHSHPHVHPHPPSHSEDVEAHAGSAHADWATIRFALESSPLDPDTVRHAIGIFSCLAAAEARVHGKSPEDVRFHEVGAWDSIADIVSAAWLVSQLGETRWSVTALPLGGGRVRTAHGLLPVPAPATALLMEGFSTIDDGISGERVTPTGAAIVRYFCDQTGARPKARTLIGSGFGFGTKRMPGISNCVRLLAFEPISAPIYSDDRIGVLECEIDDQTGEDMAHAVDNLRAMDGVIDVVQSPVFGKKGRMMTHLRVLVRDGSQAPVTQTIFEETTTIGVRHSIVERSVLHREFTEVESDGRTLHVKIVERPSSRTAKLESDDLKSVAGARQRSALRKAAERAAGL